MPGNAPVSFSENVACGARVRAEIGRRLREVYKAEQPLRGRLADLVSRIGQVPECQFQRAHGADFGDRTRRCVEERSRR
jgi:hypothetical protein